MPFEELKGQPQVFEGPFIYEGTAMFIMFSTYIMKGGPYIQQHKG